MKNIDELTVSKGWKNRFQSIEICQGRNVNSTFAMQKTPEFRSLSLWKRQRITGSGFALIFNFLWYFSKGMWSKGFIIFGFSCLYYAVLTLVEMLIGKSIPSYLYWMPVSLACFYLAVFDYYKYKVNDERIWKGAFFSKFFANKSSIVLFVIMSLGLNMGASYYYYEYFDNTNVSTVSEQSVTTGKASGVSQEVIDSALIDYRSEGDSSQYKTYYDLKDLNNDGKQEILLSDSSVCGSGGCTYSVYSYDNDRVCYIGSKSDTLPDIKGDIDCQTRLKNN